MKHSYLWLILVLAFSLRFAGIFWGKLYQDDYDRFQPDEVQHVEIGIRQIQEFNPEFLKDFNYRYQPFNVHGLGSQIALVAYPLTKIWSLNKRHLLIIGRLISIFYSLLIIWLLYRMGIFLFDNKNIGLIAGLFYALFDLCITHGRYAIPAVPYGFWAFLSIYQFMKFYKILMNKGLLSYGSLLKWAVMLGIPIGLTMSLKYDFIPIAVLSLLLLFITFKIKRSFPKLLYTYFITLAVFTISFFASNLFTFSIQEFIDSYVYLYKENKDVIPIDSHWLTNPVLYFFAVMNGSSFFIMLLMIYGIIKLAKGKPEFLSGSKKIEIAILLVFILFEFIIRWGIDTPFIRRANIFMPAFAIIAAFGTWHFLNRLNICSYSNRRLFIVAIVLYTFSLSILSQQNFWNDPHYRAADYLQDWGNLPDKIYLPPYSGATGISRPEEIGVDSAELILLNEAFFGRYTKSFTTPFRLPKTCHEVYHCFGGDNYIKTIQDIVFETGDFKIIKRFSGILIHPERIIHSYLFGSYEPFNGEYLILIRKEDEEH